MDNIVHLIESFNLWFKTNLFFSFFLSAAFSVILAYRYGNWLYNSKGRILVDMFWVVSGISNLCFLIVSFQYEPVRINYIRSYSEMMQLRSQLGHSSTHFISRWCQNWHDAPEFKGDIAQKTLLCENALNIQQRSIQFGLMMLSGARLSEFEKYVTLSYVSASSYEDNLISSDFFEIINTNVYKYNNNLEFIIENNINYRNSIIWDFVRKVFFHIIVIAGIFRFGRNIVELRNIGKNKSMF